MGYTLQALCLGLTKQTKNDDFAKDFEALPQSEKII